MATGQRGYSNSNSRSPDIRTDGRVELIGGGGGRELMGDRYLQDTTSRGFEPEAQPHRYMYDLRWRDGACQLGSLPSPLLRSKGAAGS